MGKFVGKNSRAHCSFCADENRGLASVMNDSSAVDAVFLAPKCRSRSNKLTLAPARHKILAHGIKPIDGKFPPTSLSYRGCPAFS